MSKQTQPDGTSISTSGVIGLLALVAVGLVIGWGLWSPEEQPSSSAQPRIPQPGTLSPATPEADPAPSRRPGVPDFSLREGKEGAIPLADLPKGGSLTLDLELAGDAGSDFGIKSAWIYQENREPLRIGAERSGPERFRVELPRDSLAPGRAIIELRTDENSPLALRRFAVQIR